MIPRRLKRTLLAVIGDDGVGPMWARLDRNGLQVMRLAGEEARDLGHPGIADEHILLGVLRDGTSPAAAMLHAHGLDLTSARTALVTVGPTLPAHTNPATALRAVGIDITQVKERLEATFGLDAVRAAERRVRRRARWRGGNPGPSPLCAYLLAKRAFHFAIDHADLHGDPRIEPRHLLFGAVRDAMDPTGTHLSRRSRARLTALGFIYGRPNPLRLILQAHGINPEQLTVDLSATTPR